MQKSAINVRGNVVALLLASVLSTGIALAPAPAYAADDESLPATVEEAPEVADDTADSEEQAPAPSEEIAPTTSDDQEPVSPAAPVQEEAAPSSEETPAAPAEDEGVATAPDAATTPADEPATTPVSETTSQDITETPTSTDLEPASDVSETEETPEDTDGVPDAPGVEVTAGTTVIQTSVTTGQVVEAASSAPKKNATVATKTYKKAKNQKWIVKRYKETLWYYLYNAANTKLALGVSGKAKAGAAVKAVEAASANLLDILWSFVKGTGGTYKLASAADPSLFLTVKNAKTKDGTVLALAAAKTDTAGKKSQQFYYDEVSPKINNRVSGLEGAYQLKEKKSGLSAAPAKASAESGANILLTTSTGSTFQKVYLEPVSGGYYKAWIVGARKVLAVKDSSILNGANVIQATNGSSANRYWALVDNGDGTYSLVNKASGHKLTAASTKKGANLYSGAQGSAFTLAKASLLGSGITEIKPRTNDEVSVSVSGASTKDGATLKLWTDTDKLSQRFQLISAGSGLWRVRTASSGGYLTVVKGKLVQYGKGDTKASAANTWRETFRGGWYGLMLNDGSNLALTLNKGKTSKSTPLTVTKANGKDAQHFTFDKANLIEGGVYYMTCKREVADGVSGTVAIVKGNALLKKGTKADNERFVFMKVGSSKNSVFKLINLKSGLALTSGGTVSGSFANVGQKKYTGSKYQLWQVQIADGGYLELVDNSGKGENLFGRTKNDSYNVATRKMTDNSKKNNGRSFRLEAASGWMKVGNVWHYYDDNGQKVTRNGYAYSLSKKVATWIREKSSFFKKKYFITTSIIKTRTIIWEKKYGAWVPKFDWLCTTSSPEIGSGVTGWFRLGAGSGGEVAQYVSHGRCKNLKAWSVKYAMFLVQDLAIHSTIMGSSADKQVGHRLSHGCIRLKPANVKWVWDNCKNGTGVHLYM